MVVVDPAQARALPETPEVEPNDSVAKAQLLRPTHRVAGKLDGSADADVYRVRVKADAVLRATVSGIAGADVVLEALDAKGKRLVRVDNSGEGGGETLINFSVSPGEHYLRVRLARKKVRKRRRRRKRRRMRGDAAGSGSGAASSVLGGAYHISFALRAREVGEELEPNWKRSRASTLDLDGEATGYLGWHTDTDWYRVDLAKREANTLLRVEFDGVDGVMAQLALHDARGRLVQRRWGGKGRAIALTNLALPAAQTQAFVVVRCFRSANVESRYSLRVSAETPPGLTEHEPNDKPRQATSLTPGKTIAGVLADRQDRDLYAVHAGTGALRVVAAPPLRVDLALALVDASGKVLWEVNAAGAGKPEILPVAYAASPARAVRVRAVRGSDTDATSSYHLAVTALSGGWEREPNATHTEATPLPPGGVGGFIHPKGDVDVFALPASASVAGTVALRVERKSTTPALVIELLDAAGTAVARSAAATADGSVALTHTATAGQRYFARVSAVAEASSARYGYRLMLARAPKPLPAAPKSATQP